LFIIEISHPTKEKERKEEEAVYEEVTFSKASNIIGVKFGIIMNGSSLWYVLSPS
jgi:hypothetical protein